MNIKKKLKDLFGIVDGIWVKLDSIMGRLSVVDTRLDIISKEVFPLPVASDYEHNMNEAVRLFGKQKQDITKYPPLDLSTFNESFRQGFEAGMVYLNLASRPASYGPIEIQKQNIYNVSDIATQFGYIVNARKPPGNDHTHETLTFVLREV